MNKTLQTSLFVVAVLLIAFFSFKFLFLDNSPTPGNETAMSEADSPIGYAVPKEFEYGSAEIKKQYNPDNGFSVAVISTTKSKEDIVDYYRSTLEAASWNIQSDISFGPDAHRFYASNDSNSVSIVISKSGQDIDGNNIIYNEKLVTLHYTPLKEDPAKKLENVDLDKLLEDLVFSPNNSN